MKVDVRVIARTNRNLEESVEKGEFRQDLFFRLNVVPVFVPPLRDRAGDVLFLAEKFRELFVRKHGIAAGSFSKESKKCLVDHDFPGNVRELQNVVERAVILCGADGVLNPEQVNLSGNNTASRTEGSAEGGSFQKLEDAEKDHIIRALAETGHNRTKAAKLLGVSVRTLQNKVAAYKKEAKTEEDLAKLGLDAN